MKSILIAAGLIGFAATAVAQGLKVEGMKTFKPDTLQWADDPSLPKGAKVALVVGDPSKPEPFVVHIKLPPNYKVAPHTHPFAELITVIAGSLGNGMGEKHDQTKGEVLNAGAGFAMAANHPHYVWTTDKETILELVASGPWGIKYVSPEDDPRNK